MPQCLLLQAIRWMQTKLLMLHCTLYSVQHTCRYYVQYKGSFRHHGLSCMLHNITTEKSSWVSIIAWVCTQLKYTFTLLYSTVLYSNRQQWRLSIKPHQTKYAKIKFIDRQGPGAQGGGSSSQARGGDKFALTGGGQRKWKGGEGGGVGHFFRQTLEIFSKKMAFY